MAEGNIVVSPPPGTAQLEYRFTTAADVLWNSQLTPGFGAALVADTFPDKSASVADSGWNLGGTNQFDVVLNDKTVVATGGQVIFQYVWLVEQGAPQKRLLGFWDFGEPQTVLDGQSMLLDLQDENNVAFSLN